MLLTRFRIHQYRNRYCENTLYTGFLVSLDDFYLLGSGLMMAQTTNNVFNTSLFSQVTPHSLLAWQRVRLAHSLSHTGEQWANTFSRYNSGEGGGWHMTSCPGLSL